MLEKIQIKKNRDQLLKLNSLGTVPTIELTDGKVLTQNSAILEYIADQKPQVNLLSKPGTYERADTMQWLSFINSDLHKAFILGWSFRINQMTSNTESQHDIKKWAFGNIDKYCSVLESHLKNKKYLSCERFTIADIYFYTVYSWSKVIEFPIEKYTAINSYMENIAKRSSVIAVRQREKDYIEKV